MARQKDRLVIPAANNYKALPELRHPVMNRIEQTMNNPVTQLLETTDYLIYQRR